MITVKEERINKAEILVVLGNQAGIYESTVYDDE